MRPVIGITPLLDIQRESYWMLPGYMDGVEKAGGMPVMLPMTPDEGAAEALALCDGLLFAGGQDVSPRRYGEETLPVCGEVSESRDGSELVLLRAALAADKPIFGICRGIQLLNVALGGTLWQDLPSQRPSTTEHHQKPPYHVPVHTVHAVAGTPMSELFGQLPFSVNSYHHQAIRDRAPDLLPMAMSEDGLVEGVYLPQKKFVWAVQWHPEFSFRTEEKSRALFRALVRAAEKEMR